MQVHRCFPLHAAADTPDMQAKHMAEQELHARKSIDFTVIRPGRLTDEPASGIDLGITQVTATSRDAVAKVLLAIAEHHGDFGGLTLDLMDGSDELQTAVDRAAKDRPDAWTG